ncbi:GNAT family N-acetyltransferase [Xylophilus sp. ASV27]|uniref:GNAT family N-acetyltransferase n=1 Tax=Xylophilus sp. ASV27 TaxID=2795129 RepID=UPI0018EA5C7B
MTDPVSLLQASLDAGRRWMRPSRTADAGAPALPPALVPIRSLGPAYRERIAAHLLALDPEDRYLRFGYAASDEQIRRYVDGLDFARDEIFGIYNRRLDLIAVAHLAIPREPGERRRAEFGVSVVKRARARGYGARLFRRAMMHARNAGVAEIFIYALSQNTAMLSIARKAGATVQRDGSEAEAYLSLPPADLDSRLSQLLEQQFAEVDYRLKVQAKHFWDAIGSIQEIRQGVREARQRSAP